MSFSVTLSGTVYNFQIEIQSGQYSPIQMANELTNCMNNAVSNSLSPMYAGYNNFIVVYNEIVCNCISYSICISS